MHTMMLWIFFQRFSSAAFLVFSFPELRDSAEHKNSPLNLLLCFSKGCRNGPRKDAHNESLLVSLKITFFCSEKSLQSSNKPDALAGTFVFFLVYKLFHSDGALNGLGWIQIRFASAFAIIKESFLGKHKITSSCSAYVLTTSPYERICAPELLSLECRKQFQFRS